jgi:very-short-patch-repair endonuclease
MHGNKYDYSKVNYNHSRLPVAIFCKKCNKFFNQTPNHHLMGNKGRGSGCPNCSNKKLFLTQKEFIINAKKIHDNKYDYSKVNYVNARTKVIIYCKKCKKIFQQQPRAHTNQKQGCPECRHSHGESRIAMLLNFLKFSYISQHSFPDCKSSRGYILKFDFYIPSIKSCIEYDGEQHFDKKNKWWSKYVEENDRIKEKYCFSNGITLKRISYKEFEKIEELIKSFLLSLIV